ncbi:TraB/GumN family protein [Pseudomarimonas salicorniae]|uniref:TraB/GumN family protein n=1 Tax=Pseudomarimonas salicorniae TaxID=2933270 RepID=A0ABT0GEL2_9GAMM|nr:TraB/GumN family protein [Lysobacter sp. CAU 1642]MCK7592467.1 TraB/GumN family protein [Lysobacter sp. CAU 1642]
MPLRPLLLCALLCPLVARADEPPPELPTQVLDTVVVTGEQPGPGLWRVESPQGHRMWVLASLVPLPKRMEWTATEVERRVAEADRVLYTPGGRFDVKVGFFARLGLIPAAMRARNNPGKQPLAEVVPAPLYARWTVQKKKYMPRSRSVEKRRPLVAAQTLFSEALDEEDLSWKNLAQQRVEKIAKRTDREVVDPVLDIVIEDPKALLKDFNESQLEDLDCFEKTLIRLETDIEPMKLRANAWALGAVDLLQSLEWRDANRACVDALLGTAIAERYGFADVEQRLRTLWLDEARKALTEVETSFAVLPIAWVVGAESLLTELQAEGYSIVAPGAAAEAESEPEAEPDAAASLP